MERKMHTRFMRMALSLSLRAAGRVSPNPKVGCVIVDDDGKLLSWGYHERFGGPHAEAAALARARSPVHGATVYVTLEPCCHTGKTPPCADALIAAGVSRVVIGSVDPNPVVSGRGVKKLRDAGIDVVEGVLQRECRWMNRGFICGMTLGRPWVTVKAALSLDGGMALENGDSKWITSDDSRARAHALRAENDAILVGAGTVAADDPHLSVRHCDGVSPLKVVIDPRLRTPTGSNVLIGGRCVVYTTEHADERAADALRAAGADVARLSSDLDGRIDLNELVRDLYLRGICRLMVEGGPRTSAAFIGAGLADEYALFIAPKILGRSIKISDEPSFSSMKDVIALVDPVYTTLGRDVIARGAPHCSLV